MSRHGAEEVHSPTEVIELGTFSGYTRPGTTPLMNAVEQDEDAGQKYRRTMIVQGIIIALIAIIFGLLVILIGITSATYDKVKDYSSSDSVTTVYSSLGLPGYEGLYDVYSVHFIFEWFYRL